MLSPPLGRRTEPEALKYNGSIVGVLEGDTRSLDYSSCRGLKKLDLRFQGMFDYNSLMLVRRKCW